MIMYLELERLGWLPRFVTLELTDNPMVDYVLIGIYATEAATYSSNLSDHVSRGKRKHARDGWWVHAVPPFGAKRYDLRAGKVLNKGDSSAPGGGGVILIPDEELLPHWEYAARRILDGCSLANVATELYDRGVRGLRGGKLDHSYIKKILTNPALVGEIEVNERDESGRTRRIRVQAKWDPLVDPALFRAVEEEVQRRSTGPRNRRRKKRGIYPLRPICAHCGVEYHGGRLSKAQDRSRCYVHPKPTKRRDPEGFRRFHEHGCKAYYVLADELESAIKDLIVTERASEDFELEIRELILERDEFRRDAARAVEAARQMVAEREKKVNKDRARSGNR